MQLFFTFVLLVVGKLSKHKYIFFDKKLLSFKKQSKRSLKAVDRLQVQKKNLKVVQHVGK